MEKDLLDISGEDEDNWLLKNTPNRGVTSFSGGSSRRERSYFDCSPLEIPRSSRAVPPRPPFSPIGRVTGNNMVEQPSSFGKENNSGNKVELPKLSVERQQMKKKKKNAGFNLRKSLAWDRAFSTEEGVLDSDELSKITQGLLPAIQEEFRESTSASKCTSVSPGLQALEENLFNDLPVNSKKREKKFLSGTVSKYASPSKAQSSKHASPSKPQSSLAQKKVISAQDVRSGSKRSGCPRPPPSSSLKRPANVHTTTQRRRELSFSKVSTTISDSLTVANNMKRTTQSPSKPKLSQFTQSKNSQRSLESVSFSKSTSNTKSKTKSSVASKSSIPKPSLKQARRNVISKTSEVPSVSHSQSSVVGKSNDGPMTSSDVAMLGHASSLDSDVITMDTSLVQSSCGKVGNTQSAVSRLGKPSGLRAPSPSIGYFSQSDSQPSHSAGDIHSQPSRSDVCSASRVSLIPTFNKPQVSEKVPGVNSKSGIKNIGSSVSAASLSAQSKFVKPSQERVKVDLKNTREIESEAASCSLSSQINERLQHPCIIQGDTGKLALDDVDSFTSEKVSTAKCEKVQSNSELPPSGCKKNVQDGHMSDDNRDEERKTCRSVEDYCALPLKHCPIFKDSMDSPVQGPSADELTLFNNCSQSKASNAGEEDICTTNDFSGDLATLDVHGQPLSECVHPENEDEISPLLSGEKDALIVNHSSENVVKQHEVVDTSTAGPVFLGDFASVKSDVDDLSSSENPLCFTESVFVSSGPAEAPVCVQSPCNHLEENAALTSILCDHNMVCDGKAALETEKKIEVSDVSDSTETCEADFTGSYSDCKDWLRESEEQHFSCQLVHEVKEGVKEIYILTRNERAESGPDMQIDYFTGSLDVEQEMEQVELLMPSPAEFRNENKPLGSSHEPFPERLTSEEQKQYNCSSVAVTPDVKAGCELKQTDQLRTSDVFSPAKDASAAVFSYSNKELEDYSELEDMDLVTESDSDEEPEEIMELREVHLATEPELISNLDEFSVTDILNQEYPEVETIHTASDLSGQTKTLPSGNISSSASTYGDHKRLDEDTKISRISEGMSKEDSTSGRIEHYYVGKAKIQTDTEKSFNAHVTNQDLGSHEEEEVQVVKISPDLVTFATGEEESGTLVPMDEAFSVKDDMQPNEFNLLSDDTLTSESNGDRASESSSSCTCSSDGIPLDAKLEKKPDPIIVKPPNAVPFSDEWLAAIEAAGEEILTLKSGRVQHSPTDKSSPEPSPWSPVKKKNNQGVGPYDCTKYTNKGLPPVLD
uniref:Uncharacterized protein n=5 Tax=Noccaea caerulescens TaxID=107243 RepID=A0A1J3HU44_NOCCA